MSRMVEWGGKLVPRAMFGPGLNPSPDACVQCGGMGVVPERIDEERFEVAVPCYACRRFCKYCNQYVSKIGHDCVTPVPEEDTLP